MIYTEIHLSMLDEKLPQDSDVLQNSVLRTISFYRLSDPINRPKLPRIEFKSQTIKILQFVRKHLKKCLAVCDNLKNIHFAAAVTILEKVAKK